MSGNWDLLIEQLKMNKLWFIKNVAAVLRKPGDISSIEYEPDLILYIFSKTSFLEKVISSKQIKLFGKEFWYFQYRFVTKKKRMGNDS